MALSKATRGGGGGTRLGSERRVLGSERRRVVCGPGSMGTKKPHRVGGAVVTPPLSWLGACVGAWLGVGFRVLGVKRKAPLGMERGWLLRYRWFVSALYPVS